MKRTKEKLFPYQSLRVLKSTILQKSLQAVMFQIHYHFMNSGLAILGMNTAKHRLSNEYAPSSVRKIGF